jgi:hypothetical protein
MRNTTNTLPSKSSSLEVGAGVFRVSFRQRERESERVRESVCVILIKISRGVIFWHVRFLFPLLVTRAPNSEKIAFGRSVQKNVHHEKDLNSRRLDCLMMMMMREFSEKKRTKQTEKRKKLLTFTHN